MKQPDRYRYHRIKTDDEDEDIDYVFSAITAILCIAAIFSLILCMIVPF